MNVQEFKKTVQKIVDEAHTLLRAFGSDKGLRAYLHKELAEGQIFIAPKEPPPPDAPPFRPDRYMAVATDPTSGNLVLSFLRFTGEGLKSESVATFGYLEHEHDTAANQLAQWMHAGVEPKIVHVAKKKRK